MKIHHGCCPVAADPRNETCDCERLYAMDRVPPFTSKPTRYRVMAFDREMFDRLRAVNTRLYDDRPLTSDQRRDLANAMHAILGSAIEVWK